MASKTRKRRAAAKPEPAAMRARRAAARLKRAATAKPVRKTPGKAKANAKTKSRRPRAQARTAANSNMPTLSEVAAEAAFAKKGTASAAAFRPWYWHY
jgi:hypothetical protein